ncbi:MAG TPA: hypothetical protein VH478_07165 [Trebonia sp.]|nr:hypothetical protein [Trebonia sp.]
MSAVAPGTTVDGDAALPPIIVAAADRDQDEAFDSGAFAVASDVAALVLLDGDEVAGVVAGHALRAAIGRGAIRGEFGVILPGVPTTIDWISRSCTYAENGATCGTPEQFIAPPAVMPACANPRGLAAHQFGW